MREASGEQWNTPTTTPINYEANNDLAYQVSQAVTCGDFWRLANATSELPNDFPNLQLISDTLNCEFGRDFSHVIVDRHGNLQLELYKDSTSGIIGAGTALDLNASTGTMTGHRITGDFARVAINVDPHKAFRDISESAIMQYWRDAKFQRYFA